MSGDWGELSCNGRKYDLIVGSELIYNEQSYDKIIRFLKQFLKEDGVCLMANKFYYFGVGGGTVSFKKVVQKAGLIYEIV